MHRFWAPVISKGRPVEECPQHRRVSLYGDTIGDALPGASLLEHDELKHEQLIEGQASPGGGQLGEVVGVVGLRHSLR